jgi:hypothetical protein
MNPDLTMEQSYMLHKMALEVKDYSREDLIEALLASWEDRFRQKQVFLAASKDAGFAFRFSEGNAFLPSTDGEGDLVEMDLFMDTTEELQAVIDSNNFDLDMDAIVLGQDE